MSAVRNCMVKPVGGSQREKCSGLVHIWYMSAIGASNERLMTNRSLAASVEDKCSASRSQVALPPTFLMKARVSAAACGVGSAMVISILVFGFVFGLVFGPVFGWLSPSSSVNCTVTRNIGGR